MIKKPKKFQGDDLTKKKSDAKRHNKNEPWENPPKAPKPKPKPPSKPTVKPKPSRRK